MAIEVLLPKLGLTMEEGTVDEWLVNDGDVISVGTPLLRLATDKIDVDVEAESEGIMAKAVPNGATLAPGSVLGWLLAPGEATPMGAIAPAVQSTSAVQSIPEIPSGRQRVSPNARRVASELGIDVASLRGTGPGGRVVSEDVEESARVQATKVTSPLARRDAIQAGINVNEVPTDTGYVTRKDVREAISGQGVGQGVGAPAQSSLAILPPGQESSSIIPMKGMRGTIAARMVQSLTEMAQLTHGFEVCMDAVVELRGTLKEQYRDFGLQVPSLNDFVVRAAALGLRKHPILNATITGREIHLLRRIHMGMAVAVPGGLMVPVIRDADTLSIFELARATRELAESCRAGSISLDALEGGSFAVTSLGTYGVDFFTPVINPGNVGILGVGRLRESGRWDDERFVKTQVLTLSLTFDHRAVDGAPAAEFLQTIAELLARPLVLLPGA
ncbi:MAG: 2-oxo acid dehydrogenase subunit E2 [Actinobacteria bacterium]|nr:2-oxo acid dehydrogenase subunit E2 [Actinomycetota bacterium]